KGSGVYTFSGRYQYINTISGYKGLVTNARNIEEKCIFISDNEICYEVNGLSLSSILSFSKEDNNKEFRRTIFPFGNSFDFFVLRTLSSKFYAGSNRKAGYEKFDVRSIFNEHPLFNAKNVLYSGGYLYIFYISKVSCI